MAILGNSTTTTYPWSDAHADYIRGGDIHRSGVGYVGGCLNST